MRHGRSGRRKAAAQETRGSSSAVASTRSVSQRGAAERSRSRRRRAAAAQTFSVVHRATRPKNTPAEDRAGSDSADQDSSRPPNREAWSSDRSTPHTSRSPRLAADHADYGRGRLPESREAGMENG